jgi:hypothetical protein
MRERVAAYTLAAVFLFAAPASQAGPPDHKQLQRALERERLTGAVFQRAPLEPTAMGPKWDLLPEVDARSCYYPVIRKLPDGERLIVLISCYGWGRQQDYWQP